jgi:hypothetical protein
MGHHYAAPKKPLARFQKTPAPRLRPTKKRSLLRRNPGHSYATVEDVAGAPDVPWQWPVAIGGVVVLGLLFWWGVRSTPAPVVK